MAAIYSSLLTYRLLGVQADIVSDILKFSGLVCVVTFIISSFWWTLIARKMRGATLGVLAGGLSAICIIPIPTFIGAFKTSFYAQPDLISTLHIAARYSLSTFSLAEFITIPLSMIVGVWAAR